MDISNKLTYYMKIMSAYVVNTESSDDFNAELKRVQVYIPEMQITDELRYEQYMALSGSKKGNEEFTKYPWAYNTISDVKNGDLVYVSTLSNTNGSFVILGKDTKSSGTSGVGGGGELDASSLAELVIPIILREECGFGSPPLYNQYWDSNVKDPCAVYTTKTSDAWSVGILNWDASRAYNLMYEIARQDSNWKSYFSDQSQQFVVNMSYDVSMGSSRGGTYSIMISGRTSVPSVENGIKNMASSNIGQEVQKRQARADTTSYIQGLMDEGINNPAILIYMADLCNQWGTGQPSNKPYLGKMHSAAQDPSTIISSVSFQVESAMRNYDNPSQMMKEVEALHAYWMGPVHDEHHMNPYGPRRNRVIAYIRELYKQGKLSQFSAGMTMLGDLNQVTFNGLTLAYPFVSELEDNVSFSGNGWNGTSRYTHTCKMKMPKSYHITSLFGARYLTVNGRSYVSNHTGVDFGCGGGVVLYASHDGKLEIKDSEGSGYGYHAIITFTNGSDNWAVYYGHMITNSSNQYGYYKGNTYDIKAGQPIGLVDSTGNSTGNHLHYELRRNGKYVNPLPYMGLGEEHYPITSNMTNYELK